jgi:hypothetical protein
MDDPIVFAEAVGCDGAKGLRHPQEHDSEAVRNEFGDFEGPREKGTPGLQTNGGEEKDSPNRQTTDGQEKDAPGLQKTLANTVIARTSCADDGNALEAIRRVRATTPAPAPTRIFPSKNWSRERARNPAPSDALLTLHNASLQPIMNCQCLASLVTITPADVTFALRQTAHGLAGHCLYKPHLFSAGTIDRLLRDLEGVLEQMVAHPERPISTKPDSAQSEPSQPCFAFLPRRASRRKS